MLNVRRYARENPIAFRLLGLIVVSSSLITLFAILLQLYGNFHDDVSSLEKRLDQVRISTLASITKSLWGFDQEQLSIQIHSVLDVTDVVQVRVVWRDWNNTEQTLVVSNNKYTQAEIDSKSSQFLVHMKMRVLQNSAWALCKLPHRSPVFMTSCGSAQFLLR
jgi:hypothetical protein